MVPAGETGEQRPTHRPQGKRALPLKPQVPGGASRARENPGARPAYTWTKWAGLVGARAPGPDRAAPGNPSRQLLVTGRHHNRRRRDPLAVPPRGTFGCGKL
jgi:hypothetical protein